MSTLYLNGTMMSLDKPSNASLNLGNIVDDSLLDEHCQVFISPDVFCEFAFNNTHFVWIHKFTAPEWKLIKGFDEFYKKHNYYILMEWYSYFRDDAKKAKTFLIWLKNVSPQNLLDFSLFYKMCMHMTN